MSIRAAANADAVFTVIGDKDQRYARRRLVLLYVINVDAVFFEAGNRLLAKHVPANAGNQRNITARLGSRDSLISPLAAGSSNEFTAENSFSRPRDSLEFEDHVGVRTADNYDAR